MSISALVELALGHDLRSTQAAKTPLNIYIYQTRTRVTDCDWGRQTEDKIVFQTNG